MAGHVLSGTSQNRAHHSSDDLTKITNGNLRYSTTGLLDACMKGNFEDVQCMIEVWRVNVEAAATISLPTFFERKKERVTRILGAEKLHGVTPLFVAVLINDVKIVCYLVGKGANVSSRTSTENQSPFSGITPLHAALLPVTYGTSNSREADSSNQTEIIRILLRSGADPSALSSDGTPTWMFSWIRLINETNHPYCVHPNAFSYIPILLEYEMRIDQRCPRFGRTLLHFMAYSPVDEDNINTIVKLLIEKGADFRVQDRDGITPLLFAVIGSNEGPNMLMLKLLVEREDISNTDKIEALEVAAAILLPNRMRKTDIEYCWSRAQELRKIEEASLIPKTSLNERAVDWARSSARLENILRRRPEFEMQSILFRLRIFSAMNWGVIYQYLWPYVSDYIKSRGLKLNEALFRFSQTDVDGNLLYATDFPISPQQLAELVDISWTMLETIRRFATTSYIEEIRSVTFRLIPILADTLLALKKKNDPLFNVETLKTSFELLCTALRAQLVCENDDPLALSTNYGLGKMFSFLVDLPDVMIHPIIDYLKEIVNLNNQDSNQEKLIIFACMKSFHKTMVISPSHLSFEVSSAEADVENALAFLRFFLRLGTDADAVDRFGNGPLHLLAAEPNGVLINALALLLLDSGAHLDRVNKKGLTAADVWKRLKRAKQDRNMRWGVRRRQQAGGWQDLPDWLRGDVPKLKCLSARIIRSHHVPYLKVLPSSLQSFVLFH